MTYVNGQMSKQFPMDCSMIGFAQSDEFRGVFQLAEQVVCRVTLPDGKERTFLEFHPIDFAQYLVEKVDFGLEDTYRYHSLIDGMTLLVEIDPCGSVLIEHPSSGSTAVFSQRELRECIADLIATILKYHFDHKNSGEDCVQFLEGLLEKLQAT